MAGLNTLTPDEALKMKTILETYFPWLLNGDEDASGADTVEVLGELHSDLTLLCPCDEFDT
jgi:hypothetical protein